LKISEEEIPMTKAILLISASLLGCATAASAAPERPKLKQVDPKLLLSEQYTTFTEGFGKRRQTTAEYSVDLGRTAFTISATHAKRTFADESHSAVEVAGTLYHDWSDQIYTRTHVALSSDKPVFASRQVATDLNLKLIPDTVLTVGGKYARYHGNRDVYSWSAGGTWYFGDGSIGYRFTLSDVDKLGKSHSHLATIRLKDPRGSGLTQLWLGTGTSLHEQEVLLSGDKGSFKSIALQRVQPIAGPLAVNLTLGRAWYDTGSTDYRGTTASIGLSYQGLDLFGARSRD
jgi:YaiO family outer membrane protein